MNIIGAKITTGATIGLVFNLGGTMYMVTGRPSAIAIVAGVIGEYKGTLLTRPTPENDDALGDASMGVGSGGGQEFIHGPYNAIEAIRGLLLSKVA